MNFTTNKNLKEQLDEVAEIAGYLWEKGWAERNAGNISINISVLLAMKTKICRHYPIIFFLAICQTFLEISFMLPEPENE